MNREAKKAYQDAQVSALATLPLLERALSLPAEAIGYRMYWGSSTLLPVGVFQSSHAPPSSQVTMKFADQTLVPYELATQDTREEEDSMDKPVLVTGANGLIGYAVAAALARAGRPVLGLVRRRPAETFPFDLCFGDLTDIHRMHMLFTGQTFAAVIHAGGVSGPMVGLDNPFTTIETNIMGTANILEACRIHGVKRVVYTSSTTAYGDTPPAPVGEDAPLRPTDVYGASKAAGEALVGAYAEQHGLEGVSLRISWVYGPRRTTDCLIRTLIEDALRGRTTSLDFGVGFHRQYIYVDDVVSSILAALDAPSYPRRVYNVTGGTFDTLDEIGAAVRCVLPQAHVEMKPGPDPVDTIQEEFDISAIRRDLGFTPAVGLQDGIKAYADWLESRGAGQASK